MLHLQIAEADEEGNSQTGEIVTNSFLELRLLFEKSTMHWTGGLVFLLVPELSGWLNRIINNVFVSVFQFRKLRQADSGPTSGHYSLCPPDVVLIVFNDLKWWHLTPRTEIWQDVQLLTFSFVQTFQAGRGG